MAAEVVPHIWLDDTESQKLERIPPEFLRVNWRNIAIAFIDPIEGVLSVNACLRQ